MDAINSAARLRAMVRCILANNLSVEAWSLSARHSARAREEGFAARKRFTLRGEMRNGFKCLYQGRFSCGCFRSYRALKKQIICFDYSHICENCQLSIYDCLFGLKHEKQKLKGK